MDNELKKLLETREQYRTKMFWLLLEVAFIFGIPAVIALFLYKFLRADGSSVILSLIPFIFALIISWIITLQRIKKVGGGLHALEERIKEKRNDISN